MGLARSCDRCGTLFAIPNSMRMHDVESNKFTIPHIILEPVDKYGNRGNLNEEYDLCQCCYETLTEWIGAYKVNVENIEENNHGDPET